MINRDKIVSAFSDGSKEDNDFFKKIAEARRMNLTSEDVIKRLFIHLDQMMYVMQKEIDRHREAQDFERVAISKERSSWAENLKIWVNRNV